MDLKTYLKDRKQVDLARALGVTQGAVHQWASGMTRVAVERCIAIERATDRAVTCEELRPDVDWAFLRGTAPASQAQAAINTEAKEGAHE